MKKIIVILFGVILMCGCSQKLDKRVWGDLSETKKLVVYLSAIPHGFISSENSVEPDYILYPSKYTIGTMEVGGELNCDSGNTFENALHQYEKDHNVTIELHYIEEGITDQVLQDQLINSGKLPDLMILGKYNQYDYVKLAEQGYLLDFSPWIEQDDEINNTEKYFGQVLNGGEINGKQIAMPLLFNLNACISSTDFLSYCGLATNIEYPSYEDIVYMLKQACYVTENEDTLAIYETSGNMVAGTYLPSILTGSAYTQYFDSSLNKILLEENVVESILEIMELYNRQDFCNIPNWEDNLYIENVNNANCKSQKVSFSVDLHERIGIFLTGGRSGGLNYHNSLLSDVAFFHTIYEDMEEWKFYGIPTADDSTSYSANISLAAFAFADTEHAEAVYELVRYLMDYEFPTPYGFSVNKKVTENQLENSKSTYTKVYPSYIWGGDYFGNV